MAEVITIGETMVSLAPLKSGALQQGGQFSAHLAGAESNTAIGLQRLGHTTRWISRLGNDAFGRFVRSAIEEEGVEINDVVMDDTAPTGVMFKEPQEDDETIVRYYRKESAASRISPKELNSMDFSSGKLFHFTGITPVLSAGCQAAVVAARELARTQGLLCSFDPNIRMKLWGETDYRPLLRELMFGADIVLLGVQEAQVLLNTEDISEIFQILFAAGVQYVAIKSGSSGAWTGTPEEQFFIKPYPCVSIDPVGAGDGFNAGFLSGLLEQRSILECGEMAAVVGAMATQTKGDVDGYPYRAELFERLHRMKGEKHD